MSDATIISIVGSVITFGGTVFAGLMTYHMTKLHKLAKDTHTLVNSNMGVQLAMHEAATRRLAAITSDPTDMEDAEEARRKHAAYKSQQAAVDAKNSKSNL